MEYKKITITLPQNIFKKYKEFCEDNGMNMSKRISLLLKEDLDKKKGLNEQGTKKNENKNK
jgi:metal-responsive CopG/Arc/MetJ family transcriptional regulator